MEKTEIDLALNCALVTRNTNRSISAKEPVAYLTERTEKTSIGVDQIKRRLSSHTIPFDELNVGGYSDIDDPEERARRIKADFDCFISTRADAIHSAAVKLCNGEEWTGL